MRLNRVHPPPTHVTSRPNHSWSGAQSEHFIFLKNWKLKKHDSTKLWTLNCTKMTHLLFLHCPITKKSHPRIKKEDNLTPLQLNSEASTDCRNLRVTSFFSLPAHVRLTVACKRPININTHRAAWGRLTLAKASTGKPSLEVNTGKATHGHKQN